MQYAKSTNWDHIRSLEVNLLHHGVVDTSGSVGKSSDGHTSVSINASERMRIPSGAHRYPDLCLIAHRHQSLMDVPLGAAHPVVAAIETLDKGGEGFRGARTAVESDSLRSDLVWSELRSMPDPDAVKTFARGGRRPAVISRLREGR
jgi:hypothetical protein